MRKYSLSFILALTLHLSIIGLFMLNITEDVPDLSKQEKAPEIITASILDETLVEAKAQELKQQQEDKKNLQKKQKETVTKQIEQEKKRLQQAKNKRLKEEKRAKKQAEQLKKTAQDEQKKLQAIKQKVALEKKKQLQQKQQRLAAEKKRALEKKRKAEAEHVAAEKRKKEAAEKEAALKEAAKQKEIVAEALQRENEEKLRVAAVRQAEENRVRAENAKIAKKASADAKVLIKRKVTQNWNQPGSVSGKLACTIKVGLIPSGDVMSVSVVKSSGNPLFDASVERAVYKASPLPVPKDPEVFKQFRSFKFVFSPN